MGRGIHDRPTSRTARPQQEGPRARTRGEEVMRWGPQQVVVGPRHRKRPQQEERHQASERRKEKRKDMIQLLWFRVDRGTRGGRRASQYAKNGVKDN